MSPALPAAAVLPALVRAEELVAEFGSPLYVYDAGTLRARAATLRATLPAGVEVAFATKANPSPAVLRTWREVGLGADVASGGELRAVLRAGIPAEQVVFTGPGKTDAELEAALAAAIGALTIESLDELEAVIGLAGRARHDQGLVLRLATDREAEERPIISAAGSAKFGLTDDEAGAAVERLRGAGVLAPEGPFALRGFHAFGATNVLDASLLVDGVVELTARAERIATSHDLAIELIDAGGGLGIPYDDHQAPLDIEALGAGIREELATWAGRATLRGARLLLEPGRWLSGPAGVYLCQAIRTKRRGFRDIAITDGGIHHLLRPRLVGSDHRVVPVGAAAGRPERSRVDITGPLCTGLDILATDVSLPEPRPGDLYAVLDAGAYGYSESMPLFLTHPIPAEILVDGDEVIVSRARIEPE
jgi:diaminopimelate decarboxylase